MKDLNRFINLLSDEDFGKMCKCYLFYIAHKQLPEDVDDRSEQLFNLVKDETDRKIKDKERKQRKRKLKEKEQA